VKVLKPTRNLNKVENEKFMARFEDIRLYSLGTIVGIEVAY